MGRTYSNQTIRNKSKSTKLLSNISSNYYVLVDAGEGYTSGMAVAHDRVSASSLYYQTLSDPATDVKEVWVITSSGENTYSLRALNDGYYVNGNNNGWNRSLNPTETTGDFTVTLSGGICQIVCASGSYSPGSTFGPWEGTKTTGSDMSVAINKKNNSTATGDGDNAPGFILYSIPRSAYTGSTVVDVTSTYLTNADFSATTAVTGDYLYGYGKDGTPYGFQAVDNWTSKVLAGDNSNANYPNSAMAAGVFEYGSSTTLKGNDKAAPAKDPEGNNGKCLGFMAVWGCGGYYYQEVTLPAGIYKMTVPTYNQSGTNAPTSYIGFLANDGTNYTVAANPSTGSWQTLEINFALAESTSGKIALGYQSTGNGAGSNPHLFFDCVKLSYTSLPQYANSISQKQTLAGTTDLPTSDFIPSDGAFTIEGTATAGSAIVLTSLGISYTPVKSGAIRFVRTTDNIVLVYEGEEFMTAFASGDVYTFAEITSSNVTSSEANLLSNASFETLGSAKAATDQYNPGNPWDGNIPSNARVQLTSSMESGTLTKGNGDYVLVWRGGSNNNITQPVSGLKANRRYKVQTLQIFANNGTGPFRFGLGSSAGGTQYGSVDITMGGTGDKVHRLWSGVFKTSNTTTTSGHFTLTGCTSGGDRLPCLDWISLACQDDSPVSGMTSPKYLEGSAYAPVMISEIRAEFDEVYASIATTLADESYVNITGSERSALETAKDDTYYEFTSDDSEDYEHAISDINNLISTFTAAKTNYDKLVAVRITGATYTTEDWPRATAAKKTALDNAIAAAPTSSEDALTKTNAIVTAYRQFVESNGKAEGVSGAFDFASAIAGADPGVNEDWTDGIGTKNVDGEKYTDGDGNKSGQYYDGGWSSTQGANINMSRTFTLPAGIYQLQVTARGSESLTAYTMSIGGQTINLPTDGAGSDVGTFGHGWSDCYVVFESDGSELTLNIQATSTAAYQWVSFTRFRLYSIELVHHNYTINAVAAGTTIKELATGETYESGTYTTYVPKVIEYNSQFYVLDDDNLSNYEASFTMGTSDAVEEVNYTLDESIVRFYEGETVAGTQSAYSNGAYGTVAGQNKRNRGIFASTLTPGTYQFIGSLVADGNSGRQITLREGTDDPMASLVGNNTTHMATADFTVYATTGSLYINGANSGTEKTNLSTSFDYVLIKRTGNATVSATIGAEGYATFGSQYPLDLTPENLADGVKAYKATSVNGETIQFVALEQSVPANTGILIAGEPGEITIPVATSSTPVEGENLLKVNASGETFDAEVGCSYYGLLKDSKEFHPFAPGTVAIPANKAYLRVENINPARLIISFDEEDPTAINAVEAVEANGDALKDGKYLIGNKVVLVKNGVKYSTNGQKLN